MLWKTALILCCCGLVVVTASYVCSRMITGYSTFVRCDDTPETFGLDFARFTVEGARNARISCWHVPASDSQAVIVASHGLADSKSSMFQYLLPFLNAGFSLVVYDLRHHCESTGKQCTLGYWETEDLLRITEHVKQHFATGKPVCYWGFSLGGIVSLLAAARTVDVVAVVAQGPFVSMREVVTYYARRFYFMPTWPVISLGLKFVEWRTGARVNDVDICAVGGKLSRVPILLIGSSDDRQVPLEWLERIRDSIGPSAELVVGPYGHDDDTGGFLESTGEDIDLAITFLKDAIDKRCLPRYSGGRLQTTKNVD